MKASTQKIKHIRILCALLAIFATLVTACVVAPSTALAADSGRSVMYRMYNPNSGEHFYTANANERTSLIHAGWCGEGVGWIAPSYSNTPVFRLYSGTDHHYTTSAVERDSLMRTGWSYEGIGWYSSERQNFPLYRQFNPNVQPGAARNNSGSHNYTTSLTENDNLVRNGWRAEGIGWHAIEGGYGESTAYVTPTGSKYHRSTCPTIQRSNATALPTYLAIARGYGACKDCRPPAV